MARIVVAGDRKTGKSSLIRTAATQIFPTEVRPVLPPTTLSFPDGVPLTIIDTYTFSTLTAELDKEVDAIILTYAGDRPETLISLSNYWLPRLQILEVKVPVIVVGCMMDKVVPKEQNLENVMSEDMRKFRQIEACIECSAKDRIQVAEVFEYARKALLYPQDPLFNKLTLTLSPRCKRALKRIFILCDRDKDGALNDDELNGFQIKCFGASLERKKIENLKKVVREKEPNGVNDNGLTLSGFLFIHALFIKKGNFESVWTVLNFFFYNKEIRLNADQFLLKATQDESSELTDKAVEFLNGIFHRFNKDHDGYLRVAEVEDIFSTAPENPWNKAPYRDAAQMSEWGGLTHDGFLSLWALMAHLDASRCIENLIYVGYDDPKFAIRITQGKRKRDGESRLSDRKVHHCLVFGPKEAGKSAILDTFIGRPFVNAYAPNTCDRYAVNTVEQPVGIMKTLVMHEIPESKFQQTLSNMNALAACDVALFVHDSSYQSSWNEAKKLRLKFDTHVKSTGYLVPSLIIAAKHDIAKQKPDSTVCQDMGTEALIEVSAKQADFKNLFRRIVIAAEDPSSRYSLSWKRPLWKRRKRKSSN